MKQFIFKNYKILSGIGIALLLGGITMSFQDSPFTPGQVPGLIESCKDTIPEKNNETMTMKEFDRVTEEINNALKHTNEDLIKLDIDKTLLQVNESLKKIDMEKIMKEVQAAMKEINIEKIMSDVQLSLKDINTDIAKADLNKALEEARAGIEKATMDNKNLRSKEWKEEMIKVKKEIEKSKVQLKRINVNKIMQEAKQGVEKAKEEIKLTREMITQMEKEGLISQKEGFTIEYKDKELFINGKKQPAEVRDRYLKYIKGEHFKMTIEKERKYPV